MSSSFDNRTDNLSTLQPAAPTTMSDYDAAKAAANRPIIFGQPNFEKTEPLRVTDSGLKRDEWNKDLNKDFNKDFDKSSDQSFLYDKDKGNLKDKVEIDVDVASSPLPSTTTTTTSTFESKVKPEEMNSQEFMAQSQHIMAAKAHDKAAKLAACIGSKHLQGQPIEQAVSKVEFTCNKESELESSSSGESHFITEEDVMAIRRHDQVAQEAAGAGSKLSKGGYFSKAVHVKEATGMINEKGVSGPSTMQKVGESVSNVASSIGGAVGGAVSSAKETISNTISKPSTTSTTTTTTSESSVSTGGQSNLQKVAATAASVKDTLMVAGRKSAPVLQKAATIAGQVVRTAATIAQPFVHHLAAAVAESTSTPPSFANTETSTSSTQQSEVPQQQPSEKLNTTTSSQESTTQPSSKEKLPETNLQQPQLSGEFRTKSELIPTDLRAKSSPALTVGDFMSKEEKGGKKKKKKQAKPPSQPREEMKSGLLENILQPMKSPTPAKDVKEFTGGDLSSSSTSTLPQSQPTVTLTFPDAATEPIIHKGDQQISGPSPNKLQQQFSTSTTGSGSGLNEGQQITNFQIDIQVKPLVGGQPVTASTVTSTSSPSINNQKSQSPSLSK